MNQKVREVIAKELVLVAKDLTANDDAIKMMDYIAYGLGNAESHNNKMMRKFNTPFNKKFSNSIKELQREWAQEKKRIENMRD